MMVAFNASLLVCKRHGAYMQGLEPRAHDRLKHGRLLCLDSPFATDCILLDYA